MTTNHEPDSRHGATGSNAGTVDATLSSPELLDIARAGLLDTSSPEAMLWDEIDLDDPDDRRFGDYELLERIGRGGMGVVFRARQASLGREVALKFIVGGLAGNPRMVARFLEEARAAARLHHPHIVPVFEVGSVEGLHFFTMPLLRGQTLAQRIAAARPSAAESVGLMLELGAAVEYAHSLGLLHLDLKPANVLFDEHAQPMIGDFGLARHMDEHGGVDAQEVSGTPAYMAPEQIEPGPHRLDGRTDVYALGAILYELLTGAAPHGQGGAHTQMRQATSGGIVAPRAFATALDAKPNGHAAIDADLEAICLKCLRLDPHDRYPDVAALNADLARHRDGNDVSARKPRWRERVARGLRRHPAVALASAAALAALLLGLAATSWQWQRAERALAEADRQKALATAEASRMQQLAGLMAAAFPAGESARDERANSARNAVAWLKQNAASDPAAERAVLMSFRQALGKAGKSDVVAALVGEIVDQLGEEYREQQVERLASKGDRDSLVAAALIGIPRGEDGVSSPEHEAVLRRLFDRFPDDPLALYVVALACHAQPRPCPHGEYYARLVERFPDNAVHWLLVPSGSKPTDLDIAAQVMHAADAKAYDDRLAPMTGLLRAALRDQRVPDSIGLPMQAVVEEADVAPSLRRNAVESVALARYRDVIRVCKPESAAMQSVAGLREACGRFGEHGMRSPQSSILSSMIGVVLVRRLHKGEPLDAEAKEYRRRYVWLGEHVRPDDSGNEPAHADRLQQDIARYGEWEAYAREAERAGASRTPPPGWVPKNPQTLLMTEERAPEAPHH